MVLDWCSVCHLGASCLLPRRFSALSLWEFSACSAFVWFVSNCEPKLIHASLPLSSLSHTTIFTIFHYLHDLPSLPSNYMSHITQSSPPLVPHQFQPRDSLRHPPPPHKKTTIRHARNIMICIPSYITLTSLHLFQLDNGV